MDDEGKTLGSTRRRRWLIGGATLLLGLGFSNQVAFASTKCRYNHTTHVLSITDGMDTELLVRRSGTAIEVFKRYTARVSCHGSPTVTNTDHINAFNGGYGLMTISLSGGPFAPGATPEADSSSEIEVTLTGSGAINLQGGPGADHFSFVKAEHGSGLKWNASPTDEDTDFLLPDPETRLFWVDGGRGPDAIDVLGHVSVSVIAEGGSGNDTLTGGDGGGPLGGALLRGGRGKDHIIGSPGLDLIEPGHGADLLEAGGGSDEIDMSPDKSQDRIDCGGGHDSLLNPDRFDRRRSCERVTLKKRS